MKRFLPLLSMLLLLSILCLPVLTFAAGLVPCDGTAQDPCNFEALIKGINTIINWLVMISIPLATIVIAWAGIIYISAAGDVGKVGEAKKMLWTTLIGFFFVLGAWVLVKAILSALLKDNSPILQMFFK
jgi:hypothetical protein